MKTKMATYTLDKLPPLTKARRAKLKALATRPDSDIDTSDIPEMAEEQWLSAGRLLKPFDDAASFFVTPQAERCNWCLSPYHAIYRSGLCRHCCEIRSEKGRLAREVRERMGGGMPWRSLELKLRIDCHVAGKVEDIVKAEGQSNAERKRTEHSSMAIEDLLRYISCRLLPRKERHLYYGYATIISGLFSPAQRAALIHLLSKAVDLHRRHNRKKCVKANIAELVEESQQMPTWLAEALRENKIRGHSFGLRSSG